MLKKVFFYISIMCLLNSSFLFADERDYPVDIIIALDKSLSMVEEIDAVKEYINTAIIDDKLQKDDYFLVVSFFGRSTITISTMIEGEEHKKVIKQYISTIGADGSYTDIGRALDAMQQEIELNTDATRQKLLLLITDGLHNPEPTSKYFTESGIVSHEYLENIDETQKDGWKIIVIGIGKESAREIAEEFHAEYIETSDNVTAEELFEIIPEGIINLTGDIEVTAVDISGNAVITVLYKSSLYKEAPEVVIDSIQVDSPKYISNILSDTYSFILTAEGEGTLEIPIVIPDFEPGEYNFNITFNFSSKEKFDANHSLLIKVNTLWENFPWLFPLLIALGIIILIILVLVVLRAIQGKALKFRLIVEEHPLGKGKDEFTAKKGKDMYIRETLDIFGIVPKKTRKCIAKLALTGSGLRMTIIKEDRFPDFIGIPENVLGSKIIVRTEKGEDFNIRFIEIK